MPYCEKRTSGDHARILLSGVASTPTRTMLHVPNLLPALAVSALLCLGQSLGAQQRTNTDPEPGSFSANPVDGQEYAWIPPGSFRMGCVPDDEECDDDERPLHFVEISRGFWMARAHTTVLGQQHTGVETYIRHICVYFANQEGIDNEN